MQAKDEDAYSIWQYYEHEVHGEQMMRFISNLLDHINTILTELTITINEVTKQKLEDQDGDYGEADPPKRANTKLNLLFELCVDMVIVLESIVQDMTEAIVAMPEGGEVTVVRFAELVVQVKESTCMPRSAEGP